jgi:hypothetical protein
MEYVPGVALVHVIVGGDPAVLLRVGATSGGIAAGSLSSLYAIAAGGLRRDRPKG